MAKPSNQKVKKPGFFKRIANYFVSVFAELKKVSWPTKKELFNHTWVVIVIIAIFTFIVFVFDIVFGFLLEQLSYLA